GGRDSQRQGGLDDPRGHRGGSRRGRGSEAGQGGLARRPQEGRRGGRRRPGSAGHFTSQRLGRGQGRGGSDRGAPAGRAQRAPRRDVQFGPQIRQRQRRQEG